jgi:hypothetical protein
MLDTKMSGTLQIMKKSLDYFLVYLFGVLHELKNHTNSKGNVRSTMSKINKIVDTCILALTHAVEQERKIDEERQREALFLFLSESSVIYAIMRAGSKL